MLQAFPDGIYWLTVGQKPKVLDLQNQLLRQLTDSKICRPLIHRKL